MGFVALHSMKAHWGLDWGHSYPRRANEGIVQFQNPAAYFREINHAYQLNMWMVGPRAESTHGRREIHLVHAGNLSMMLR